MVTPQAQYQALSLVVGLSTKQYGAAGAMHYYMSIMQSVHHVSTSGEQNK